MSKHYNPPSKGNPIAPPKVRERDEPYIKAYREEKAREDARKDSKG